MSYSKPTVTKLGSVTELTKGGLKRETLEIMSYRANSGGN